MTNSATSTDARRQPAGGFHAWHFFTLLSMIAATAAVIVSRDTHPVALLLLSAAVICAGFVGVALTRAVAGFFSRGVEPGPLAERSRIEMERQKRLVLRSIKELEFDHAMGKVDAKDFAAISSQLRARAIALMQDLDRAPAAIERPQPRVAPGTCAACGTANDTDARFCKACGAQLETGK